MPLGLVTIEYTDERTTIRIRSGNHVDEAIFGPTDHDNIAFYARDKFIELNAAREADEAQASRSASEPDGEGASVNEPAVSAAFVEELAASVSQTDEPGGTVPITPTDPGDEQR